MSEYFISLTVGNNITELPKSTLPASAGDGAGHYPFFCSSPEVKATTTWLQEKSAVLMGTGGVASVNYGEDKFAYSTDTWGFRSNNINLGTKFLFRKVQQHLPRIDYAGFEGSGLRHLRKYYVKKLKINVPSPDIQTRIVAILHGCDFAIENTEALIAKYQQIKAGLMHDLFTRGVTVYGKLRTPREQAPKLYHESPIGWIPKEWEVKALPQVAAYQHGRPFPSTDYSDEGALLLRPGNLHVSGIVNFDAAHTTRIPNRWLRECPDLVLKQQDIVMNLTAQSLEDQFLGRVCIVRETEPALLNQRIARFFPRQVEHHFLYWLLKSVQFRKQIDRTSQGTKVQHLYNSDLNRVLFAVPSSSQGQGHIAALLLSVTESLLAEELSVKQLHQQKSGLMHDLLTGKVRVKIHGQENTI